VPEVSPVGAKVPEVLPVGVKVPLTQARSASDDLQPTPLLSLSAPSGTDAERDFVVIGVRREATIPNPRSRGRPEPAGLCVWGQDGGLAWLG
jgi:hypothetical protein